MSITIKKIAEYSGVSVPTVSKILNNKGNVRKDLRIRVQAIIEKYNYRPSALARGMKLNKTNTIGLIIPKIINSFYVEVIEQIEKEAKNRNYTMVLGNSDEDIDREVNCLRTFLDMRVDGLIIASCGRNQELRIQREFEYYKALNIPIVLISRSLPNLDVDTVELDNVGSAYKVTKYLIKTGHKKIGIISSSIQTSAGQERIDGYLKALDEYKLPFEQNLAHIGGTTIMEGYKLTNSLLKLYKPTAIFVGSNFQLLGALQAIKKQKINIPDDISLIGFHDSEWIQFSTPPLTVVTPDTYKFSMTAINLLFDRINGSYLGKGRRQIIPTKIVYRKSVKQIK